MTLQKDIYTLKIDMEHEDHQIEQENHLPNLYSMASMSIFFKHRLFGKTPSLLRVDMFRFYIECRGCMGFASGCPP